MSIKNFQLVKISNFLSSEIYHIPQYQRGYSWEESQIEDFWIDLKQVFKDDNQDEHFLGQIVVHEDLEQKKFYIIDGQQRVSTAVILLDILRTKFDGITAEFNSEDARNNSDDINANYIGRITETKENQRLWLGDSNRNFFFEIIQKRGPINYYDTKLNKKSLSESNYNILSASKYFDKAIQLLIEESDQEELVVLERLYTCFIERFKVMSVTTDDINEAYIIFETLNARGKDLETSDLLKNHILRTAQHNMDAATNKWNKIIDNLNGKDLGKFIRYYWNSKHEFIREKDLYKALRKDADTPKKIERLLEDLVVLSELYVSLLSLDDSKFFSLSELNERISEISKLKATSFYPIIFSLYSEEYTEVEINSILKVIESLIVRNIVVGGRTANKYEVEFAKIAYQISEEILNDVTSINDKISSLIVADESFINDFKLFYSKTNKVDRYLLRKLNNHSTSEIRIIDDSHTVHLEHILPKNLKSGHWNDFINEDHEEYLWRLGNLTLLGQEFNKQASNSEFENKKEIYRKSDIGITKELLEYSIWNKDSIDARQENFAKEAVKIWEK